jgi:hypothetical protein
MEEYRSASRWHISVCPGGTVHIHYGTGSLHILEEDFLNLLADLQQASEVFRAALTREKLTNAKRLQ